ncbi:MAG: outer membrane protein assembly factor BamB [Gammaproteobacteria bacterium]|nr:outer membrane protein assembly factor BamB [Gammaproteobacteria bacterium]MBU2223621.1 outer membrane protein assembly factor BamB [Gammaproteobacteria bacterium]MBU2279923.1 outer membrane protein assembly factor BamB [Gammaproteobacteria bacterium]MBU2426253.1 outer membrane protein assembly factor BamB [Gammaproteobacteria bacterium]
MKLSVKPFGIAVLLLLALSACSSKDDDEPTLPEITNKVEPKEVWSSSIGSGIKHYDAQLKPAIFDNKVFAASRDGEVAAFDLSSGSKLWSIDLRDGDNAPMFGGLSHWWNGRSAKIGGAVTVGFDKVLIGTEDGEVLALNPQTGEKIWSVNIGGEVLASPVAAEGLVLVSTGGGRIFALQPDTGEQRWMHETENGLLTLRGISQVAGANGGVIFGTGNGKVGALISDKGVPAWEEQIAVAKGATDLARIIDVDATPIVQDGKIFAIAYNGQLVALDLRTGRELWKREYASFRDMAYEDNVLYVVDSVGKMYAIDARSGLESWAQLVLNRHFVTAPTVYKKYLVVGDAAGNLHWFDKATGEYLSRNEFDSSGFYAEAVATSEYLLLQSRNGEITLLSVPE